MRSSRSKWYSIRASVKAVRSASNVCYYLTFHSKGPVFLPDLLPFSRLVSSEASAEYLLINLR
jgi:hypothetical protein